MFQLHSRFEGATAAVMSVREAHIKGVLAGSPLSCRTQAKLAGEAPHLQFPGISIIKALISISATSVALARVLKASLQARKKADKEQVFSMSDGPNQMNKGLRNSLNAKTIQHSSPIQNWGCCCQSRNCCQLGRLKG